MADAKKSKIPPQSPLAQAMKEGTLGAAKPTINGDSEKTEPAQSQPQTQKEVTPESIPLSQKGDEPAQTQAQKRRITAYVDPTIYKWAKYRAVDEDKDLSAIVESALRLYKDHVSKSD